MFVLTILSTISLDIRLIFSLSINFVALILKSTLLEKQCSNLYIIMT